MKDYLVALCGLVAAILLTATGILWSWGVELHDVVRILTR